MSFLANPLVIGGLGAAAGALFSKASSPKIKIPDMPVPKEPTKGPVMPSDTAATVKAGIAARARRGRGIGGLVLSQVGGGAGAAPVRQTLLGG